MSFVTDEFSVKVTKINLKIGVINSQLTFLFLTYLKLMNYGLMVRDSLLNFVDCESDLESNSPDIRAL